MILTELSTPPQAAIPVRVLADHLRLGTGFADDGSEDAVLELYLRSAIAAIEARLGLALLARPFSWSVTRWREQASQGLPVGPIQTVDSILVVSGDGSEVAIDPEDFDVVERFDLNISDAIGMTWDLDVAHLFKRLTAIGQIFGNADWHLDKLAS